MYPEGTGSLGAGYEQNSKGTGEGGKATVFLIGFLKTGIRVGVALPEGKVLGANPNIR